MWSKLRSKMAKMGSSDMISNLANFLPTGTILAFQTVAPLFTNNEDCHNVERVMTSILIFTFSVIVFVLAFSDSLNTESGKVYYGIVTPWGLYNPHFRTAKPAITGLEGNFYFGDRYILTFFDVVNGILGVTVFGTLTLLTPPVSTCFFPHIPNTIVKSVPVLVAILVGAYFAIGPAPRKGLGYATHDHVEKVGDADSETVAQPSKGASESLPNGQKGKDGAEAAPPTRSSEAV